MAIEFVCPSCRSKHACADHMAGRQFRCGGCGKILEVPATSQAGVAAGPRRGSTIAADAVHADADQTGEHSGMPVWMQVTLLIFGSVTLILIAGFVLCAGLGYGLWFHDAPGPPAGAGFEVKEEEPRPVAPAKKE